MEHMGRKTIEVFLLYFLQIPVDFTGFQSNV